MLRLQMQQQMMQHLQNNIGGDDIDDCSAQDLLSATLCTCPRLKKCLYTLYIATMMQATSAIADENPRRLQEQERKKKGCMIGREI